VDRSNEHVEGVLREEARHDVHLVGVVVDLEADLDRQPLVLGALARVTYSSRELRA